MKLDAMKRQGQRSDLTSDPLGQKLKGKVSVEVLAADSPDGKTQIQRFIRLTELITPILEMVDDGKIAFRPAVELSYLSKEQQESLYNTMECEDCTPSLAQAIKMKEFSKDDKLSDEVILSIIQEENQIKRNNSKYRKSVYPSILRRGRPHKRLKIPLLRLWNYTANASGIWNDKIY